MRHLPGESACNRALGGDGLTIGEYLLFDLVQIHTGEPHPADPRARRAREEREAELAAAKRRSDERRRRLGITGSVLRKSA